MVQSVGIAETIIIPKAGKRDPDAEPAHGGK